MWMARNGIEGKYYDSMLVVGMGVTLVTLSAKHVERRRLREALPAWLPGELAKYEV